MTDEGYYQALEAYDGTIIASHSNPRKFSDTHRQLSDEMIVLLAERDGVMGVVPYNRFLSMGVVTRRPEIESTLIDCGGCDRSCLSVNG